MVAEKYNRQLLHKYISAYSQVTLEALLGIEAQIPNLILLSLHQHGLGARPHV